MGESEVRCEYVDGDSQRCDRHGRESTYLQPYDEITANNAQRGRFHAVIHKEPQDNVSVDIDNKESQTDQTSLHMQEPASSSSFANNQIANIIQTYDFLNDTTTTTSQTQTNTISDKGMTVSISTESSCDNQKPPRPSTDEEKAKLTWDFLIVYLALAYALLLIVSGAIVFLMDAALGGQTYGEIFCLYMVTVGLIFFVILYIDIKIQVKKVRKINDARTERQRAIEEMMQRQNEIVSQPQDGSIQCSDRAYNEGSVHAYNTSVSETKWPQLEYGQPHDYCFAQGHVPGFYVKLGATWFCFGLLVHSLLKLCYQIGILTSKHIISNDCINYPTLALDVLFPVYSFFLVFFIFKYSNVVINKAQRLAKFCLMHAIGTSLTFWIFTIITETIDAINLKSAYLDKKYPSNSSNATTVENPESWKSDNKTNEYNIFARSNCPGSEDLNRIYMNLAPYLYPFTIEFCILISGILFTIYANVGNCAREKGFRDSVCTDTYPQSSEIITQGPHKHCNRAFTTSLVIHADCHAASKGIFAGLIVFVGSVVSIILFFVVMTNEVYRSVGIFVNNIQETILLAVMTLSVIVAYRQTSRLDVAQHPRPLLDAILLFIAIPAFFMDLIFSMNVYINTSDTFRIIIVLLETSQILIQTPFIIDGLRRCSNSETLRQTKPGRGLVTFLVICNVAMWFTDALSIKNGETGDERYTYYGNVNWNILNHLSLPLTMFYRFHSSVCLVDIWLAAYVADSSH